MPDKEQSPSMTELCERLNDEAMRLQGRGIDRGCVDSSLAANLALEAAARIEALLAEREKLRALLDRVWSCRMESGEGRFVNLAKLRAVMPDIRAALSIGETDYCGIVEVDEEGK